MDKRKEKTNKIIKNSLVALINKHPINQISVIQICENANINRGTFYLHYRNMKVLIKKTQTEIIDNVISILKANYKDNRFDYRVAMINIVDYVKDEKEFLKAMLGKNGDITFLPRIINDIEPIIIKAQNIPEDDYLSISICRFMFGGTLSILQKWLDNDCKDDVYSLIAPFGFGYFALYRQAKKLSKMFNQ